MIRRPPRSTLSSSSAASDVYKRQRPPRPRSASSLGRSPWSRRRARASRTSSCGKAVSYTHLRAHETPEHLVCRLLLEKKKNTNKNILFIPPHNKHNQTRQPCTHPA